MVTLFLADQEIHGSAVRFISRGDFVRTACLQVQTKVWEDLLIVSYANMWSVVISSTTGLSLAYKSLMIVEVKQRTET